MIPQHAPLSYSLVNCLATFSNLSPAQLRPCLPCITSQLCAVTILLSYTLCDISSGADTLGLFADVASKFRSSLDACRSQLHRPAMRRDTNRPSALIVVLDGIGSCKRV